MRARCPRPSGGREEGLTTDGSEDRLIGRHPGDGIHQLVERLGFVDDPAAPASTDAPMTASSSLAVRSTIVAPLRVRGRTRSSDDRSPRFRSRSTTGRSRAAHTRRDGLVVESHRIEDVDGVSGPAQRIGERVGDDGVVVDHDDGTAHCSSLSPGWGMTAPGCAGPTGWMAPLRCWWRSESPTRSSTSPPNSGQLGMDVLPSGDAVHVAAWFDVVVVTGPLPPHVRADVVVQFQISGEVEATSRRRQRHRRVHQRSHGTALSSSCGPLGRPPSGAVSSTLAPPPAAERMTREPPSCSARCSIDRRPKPRWPTVVRSNP